MQRLTLLAALVGVLSTPAAAEYIQGSRNMVAGWQMAAYDDDKGKFSHCAMSTPYKSGITMYYSVSGNYSWRVGWSHPNWQFTKGQSVSLEVYVDDAGPINLRADAVTKDMALAELPPKSAVFDMMRKGYRMTVLALGNRYAFNLDGTYAALTEVLACATRYSGVAAPATTPPAMVPRMSPAAPSLSATADQRLEATKVVANILAQGDMTGARILSAKEVADLKSDYFTKSDVVWKAEGVLGTLRVIPKALNASAKDIATAVVADDLKSCKGQSVSGTTKDERNGSVVRMFTGCQEAGDTMEFRYTVVPLEDGSFYLFATAAKSIPGDRKTEAAKAETLLREAVYEVLKR